jgi:hypothetical protein
MLSASYSEFPEADVSLPWDGNLVRPAPRDSLQSDEHVDSCGPVYLDRTLGKERARELRALYAEREVMSGL